MDVGQKFSQIYLKSHTPVNDSQRMRNRLSAFYWELLKDDSAVLIRRINLETGAKIAGSLSLYRFFETCEIRDLLDSITIIYQNYHINRQFNSKALRWHSFVSRVFKEENLGYRLDELGGVHFYQDEEFERSRNATISGISNHPAVREAFEKAYGFLDQDIPDTASAIRAVFEALEIMYKHLINAEGKERLNSHGVQKNLKPIIQNKLNEQPVERQASEHLLDGFCDLIQYFWTPR